MKKLCSIVLVLGICAMPLLIVGCGEEKPATPATPAAPATGAR